MLAGAGAFASDDLARVTIDPRSRRQAVAGVQGGEGSTTLRPVPFLRGRLDTGSLIRTDYTQDCDRGICYQRIRRILPSRISGFTLTYKHYRTNAEQTRANHLKPKPITSSTFLSRVRAILRILCCVATTGFECLAFRFNLIGSKAAMMRLSQ